MCFNTKNIFSKKLPYNCFTRVLEKKEVNLPKHSLPQSQPNLILKLNKISKYQNKGTKRHQKEKKQRQDRDKLVVVVVVIVIAESSERYHGITLAP